MEITSDIKTKWNLFKVKIILRLLLVCIAFLSGCTTKQLWQPGAKAQPKYNVSGEVTQVLFTKHNDKVFFKYRLLPNNEKDYKSTSFPKYEMGFFSFDGYNNYKLKKILNDPYANKILKIYGIFQHHASELNSQQNDFLDCFRLPNFLLGDEFRMIISLTSTVESGSKINFKRELPQELKEFSLEKHFAESSIFFVYGYSAMRYFDFVNRLNSASDSIDAKEDVYFTIDFYVMKASYENSLPMRIFGTPFTIGYEIITFPFQIFVCELLKELH